VRAVFFILLVIIMNVNYRPSESESVQIKQLCEQVNVPYETPWNTEFIPDSLNERESKGYSRNKSTGQLLKLLGQVLEGQSVYRDYKTQDSIDSFMKEDQVNIADRNRALTMWQLLKEAGAIYGTRVFNFAFQPFDSREIPPVVIFPENFTSRLWKAIKSIGIDVSGVGNMIRVDAIRTQDGFRIIELNPCWVDNLGA